MKRQDFIDLKIGDIVEVMNKNQNYKKKGIVRRIDRERIIGDPTWKGSVYVEPIDCIFTFSRHMHRRRFKDGLVRLFKDEISNVGINGGGFVYLDSYDEYKNKQDTLTDRKRELNSKYGAKNIGEKRDQSLEFRFEGSKEEVEAIMEEVKRIAKEVAPEAILTMEYIDKK